MRWAIRLGRIAGIEVRIHLTFFLLLAYLGFAGYQTAGAGEALKLMLLVCIVFSCVLLHEFGHAFAARRCGIRTPDITLFPFGGVARIERMPENPRQEIFIALAGPAVNVIIAGVLWAVLAISGRLASPEHMGTLGTLAFEVMWINAVLLGFNLIPAFPMDGGRVLRALLAMRLDHGRATRIAAHIGQALAVALGLLGVFGMSIRAHVIEPNPMLIVVAFFVFMAAANEAGAVQLQSVTRGLSVAAAMVTDFRSLPRNASLGEASEMLLHSSQHEFPVIDPDGTLRGIFTRSELVSALRESGPEGSVLGVMREGFPIVHPRTPFDEGFRLMQQSGTSVLPVTDEEGRLVGLFTMENIGEMLMVRTAIAQSRRGRKCAVSRELMAAKSSQWSRSVSPF
jgi:stage IV sporulation protein FB